MLDLNSVSLIGNACKDPEVREFGGGKVANIRLAANRKYTAKSGEKREEVLYIDVSCFGTTAGAVQQYVHKGDAVLVQGRLKMEEWQDKAGEKRSKIVINCDRIQFLNLLSKGGDKPHQPNPSAQPSRPAPDRIPGVDQPAARPSGNEDDVPF